MQTFNRFVGRKLITTSQIAVTQDNVIDVLKEALLTFSYNRFQIKYLYDYYRGVQPILERKKDVRPEICNKIVENRAYEIVSFKIGYQFFEPIQYVSRSGEENDSQFKYSEEIKKLNTLMFAEDKASHDRDLFQHLCVCGIGHRLVLPDVESDEALGGSPFEIYTLDPRSTFVIHSADYRKKPLAGVFIGKDESGCEIFTVYTDKQVLTVNQNQILEVKPNIVGQVPIIEYELNNDRMGAFEPVLALLDAINAIQSNRMDGIEQTVQSLMKFINCDVSEDDVINMLKLGAVKVKTAEGERSDVDILRNDLDQTQTQIAKEDIYQAIVDIVGIPSNHSGGSSTSDTGAAVILRDGWTLAESHAKSYELQFKKFERLFLSNVLQICALCGLKVDLCMRDIELAFNRRNYENQLVKTQVLTSMLDNAQIDPQLAFQHCGMFSDPEAAYLQSMKYAKSATESGVDTPDKTPSVSEQTPVATSPMRKY